MPSPQPKIQYQYTETQVWIAKIATVPAGPADWSQMSKSILKLATLKSSSHLRLCDYYAYMTRSRIRPHFPQLSTKRIKKGRHAAWQILQQTFRHGSASDTGPSFSPHFRIGIRWRFSRRTDHFTYSSMAINGESAAEASERTSTSQSARNSRGMRSPSL